jgi:hypothetical protein
MLGNVHGARFFFDINVPLSLPRGVFISKTSHYLSVMSIDIKHSKVIYFVFEHTCPHEKFVHQVNEPFVDHTCRPMLGSYLISISNLKSILIGYSSRIGIKIGSKTKTYVGTKIEIEFNFRTKISNFQNIFCDKKLWNQRLINN